MARRKLLWAGRAAPKFMFLLGRNTPGIWGLGRELHKHASSSGSLLPAYSCEHRHTHIYTHTHTIGSIRLCTQMIAEPGRERDHQIISVCPSFQHSNALPSVSSALPGSTQSMGFLPPPGETICNPQGSLFNLFFFFFLGCMCMGERDRPLETYQGALWTCEYSSRNM